MFFKVVYGQHCALEAPASTKTCAANQKQDSGRTSAQAKSPTFFKASARTPESSIRGAENCRVGSCSLHRLAEVQDEFCLCVSHFTFGSRTHESGKSRRELRSCEVTKNGPTCGSMPVAVRGPVASSIKACSAKWLPCARSSREARNRVATARSQHGLSMASA